MQMPCAESSGAKIARIPRSPAVEEVAERPPRSHDTATIRHSALLYKVVAILQECGPPRPIGNGDTRVMWDALRRVVITSQKVASGVEYEFQELMESRMVAHREQEQDYGDEEAADDHQDPRWE